MSWPYVPALVIKKFLTSNITATARCVAVSVQEGGDQDERDRGGARGGEAAGTVRLPHLARTPRGHCATQANWTFADPWHCLETKHFHISMKILFFCRLSIQFCTREAVKGFQQFNGLEETGQLDERTEEELRRPRCRLQDFSLQPAQAGPGNLHRNQSKQKNMLNLCKKTKTVCLEHLSARNGKSGFSPGGLQGTR